MDYLILLLFFVTVVLIVIACAITIFSRKLIVKERLLEIKEMFIDIEADSEMKEPFIKRVIEPMYHMVVRGFANAAPKSIREKYENLILAAAPKKKTTFNKVLLNQLILMSVYVFLMYFAFTNTGGKVNIPVMFFGGLLGFATPILLLYSKASKRKDKIRKALPDFLDLLYVSVEAGLGLDLALKRSSEKMIGPLSEEILKTINEIAKGRVREDAFRGLSNRNKVKELTSFVSAVIQTEQLGSDIANMLRVQSIAMREARRQKAEEAAAKITVKMMFPLIFLMFPSLFVVILGPAIINIFESFTSGSW